MTYTYYWAVANAVAATRSDDDIDYSDLPWLADDFLRRVVRAPWAEVRRHLAADGRSTRLVRCFWAASGPHPNRRP